MNQYSVFVAAAVLVAGVTIKLPTLQLLVGQQRSQGQEALTSLEDHASVYYSTQVNDGTLTLHTCGLTWLPGTHMVLMFVHPAVATREPTGMHTVLSKGM